MYTAAKSKTKIYKLQHGKYGVKIEQVWFQIQETVKF